MFRRVGWLLCQFVFSAFRVVGIDLYDWLAKVERSLMWRRAYSPRSGFGGAPDFCVAVACRELTSEAQVGRDFICKMERTGLPFSVFDMNYRLGRGCQFEDDQVRHCLRLAKRSITSRNVLAFFNYPSRYGRRQTFASQPAWEFETGRPPWFEHWFDGLEHIVVNSDFCRAYFEKVAPPGVRVHKIRYPFLGGWVRRNSRQDVRRRFNVPEAAFAVFFHFNLGSSVPRKNPEGVVAAFTRAFSLDSRAHLVLKVVGCTAQVEELRSRVAHLGERVTVVDERLSHQEILDLIASMDVYVSLHRGEGFGIGMLEAMEVGTPVVCTNYGGNTEFCTVDTAFLIGYKLVPNRSGEAIYSQVAEWPEPDVEQAANYLRMICDDPQIGRAKAQAASVFIAQHFSVENFKEDVLKYLRETAT